MLMSRLLEALSKGALHTLQASGGLNDINVLVIETVHWVPPVMELCIASCQANEH